jgi:hypothetical protein
MRNTTESISTIDLGYEQLLCFDGGPGSRLRVLYGATWLTVRAGDEVSLRDGRTLAQALEPSRLQIVSGAGGRLQALRRALRRFIARQQFGPVPQPEA